MRLLQVTNWYYLLTLTVFFLFAGVILYFFINFQLTKDIDEQLNYKRIELVKSLSLVDSLSLDSLPFHDNLLICKSSTSYSESVLYFDKVILDKEERKRHSHINPTKEKDFKFEKKNRIDNRKRIPFRIIHFQAKSRCFVYDVKIWQSEVESEDLIESIFFSLMAVFGVSCIILFVSNYFFSKRLLSPLFTTIYAVNNLDIKRVDDLAVFETSPIKEFNELNNSLQKMINQLTLDYHQMKEFTENAAHELQTPVAIIRTKLETLMQNEELNNIQAQLIHQALENTVRLSKINQTLLLLSKIESNQFGHLEQIVFSEVFTKIICSLEDILFFREINLSIEIEDEFTFTMNRGLAEILVSNLLSNSINHNFINGGDVFVTLHQSGFVVENSGDKPEASLEQMFERFKKGNHSSSNVGLGLALVKEIAENSALLVSFHYDKELYRLCVDKKQ